MTVQLDHSTVGSVRKDPRSWPKPPSPRAARRAAAAREPGTPIQLVILFRAPPPIKMVAGRMWVDAPTRKVTVLGRVGSDRSRAFHALAVRRANGWVGYADGHDYAGTDDPRQLSLTTGPLDPRERDITWSWGWKSVSAKALRVMEALR